MNMIKKEDCFVFENVWVDHVWDWKGYLLKEIQKEQPDAVIDKLKFELYGHYESSGDLYSSVKVNFI